MHEFLAISHKDLSANFGTLRAHVRAPQLLAEQEHAEKQAQRGHFEKQHLNELKRQRHANIVIALSTTFFELAAFLHRGY